MGKQLDRAMAPVLRDLAALGAPVPEVEESDWQTFPGAESGFLRGADGTGQGVWIDIGVSEAEQVATLADQVQDWVVELAHPRMTSWPPCPDHPANHPMTAVVLDGEAVWVCMSTRRSVSEVGRL